MKYLKFMSLFLNILLFFTVSNFHSVIAQEESDFVEQEFDPIHIGLSDKIIDTILGSNILIKKAIAELTQQRCRRFLTSPGQLLDKFYVYSRGTISLNPSWSCRKVSIDLIQALDFHQEQITDNNGQSYFLRLVFKNRLTQLIQSPQTTLVLKNMINYMRSDFFNLYDSVYEILPNHEKTLEFIGVLLQDFSSEKLHYHFLQLEKSRGKIPKSSIVDENLILLEKILSRLPFITNGEFVLTDEGTLKERIVEFYPAKSLLNGLNIPSLAYHYYVPAYVAFKLSRTYGNSDVHSYLASFSFNYFYEILFREDLKLTRWSMIKQLFSIQDIVIRDITQAFDIYLGHEGPYFALGYSNHKWPPLKFVKQIHEDPFPAYHQAIQFLR